MLVLCGSTLELRISLLRLGIVEPKLSHEVLELRILLTVLSIQLQELRTLLTFSLKASIYDILLEASNNFVSLSRSLLLRLSNGALEFRIPLLALCSRALESSIL